MEQAPQPTPTPHRLQAQTKSSVPFSLGKVENTFLPAPAAACALQQLRGSSSEAAPPAPRPHNAHLPRTGGAGPRAPPLSLLKLRPRRTAPAPLPRGASCSRSAASGFGPCGSAVW